MIFESLSLIKEELGVFIQTQDPLASSDSIILGNIALLETTEGADLKNKIVISLVNVEEEKLLKNIPANQRTTAAGVVYENPPVHLNLYLLFTANWQDNYESALKRLSMVVEFFQSRQVFSLAGSPHFQLKNTKDIDDPEMRELRLVLDLYSMTFEQINHLWGSLGGKQAPFVMYKARLARILHRQPLRTGPAIEEIEGSGTINPIGQ